MLLYCALFIVLEMFRRTQVHSVLASSSSSIFTLFEKYHLRLMLNNRFYTTIFARCYYSCSFSAAAKLWIRNISYVACMFD